MRRTVTSVCFGVLRLDAGRRSRLGAVRSLLPGRSPPAALRSTRAFFEQIEQFSAIRLWRQNVGTGDRPLYGRHFADCRFCTTRYPLRFFFSVESTSPASNSSVF